MKKDKMKKKSKRELRIGILIRYGRLLAIILVCIYTFVVTTPSLLWSAPIHTAASYGNIAKITKLLKEGEDIDARDYSGESALFYAVDKGNIGLVSYLIKKGANVNLKDKNGWTPIFMAYPLRISIIQLLVKKGADISVRSTKRTIKSEKIAVGDFVYTSPVEYSANITPLHKYAVQMGFIALPTKIGILKKMKKYGADLTAVDKKGKTWEDYEKIGVNIVKQWTGICLQGDCENGKGVQRGIYGSYEKWRYVGNFTKEKKNGKGKLTVETTDRRSKKIINCIIYDGKFKKGKKHGIGKEYENETGTCKKAKLVYSGEFKNDKRHGTGKLYNAKGIVEFEGKFRRGKSVK